MKRNGQFVFVPRKEWKRCDCTNDGCTGHLESRTCHRLAKVRIVLADRLQEPEDHSRFMCFHCATDYAQLGRIIILDFRSEYTAVPREREVYMVLPGTEATPFEQACQDLARYQDEVAKGWVDFSAKTLEALVSAVDRLAPKEEVRDDYEQKVREG